MKRARATKREPFLVSPHLFQGRGDLVELRIEIGAD